MRRTIKTILLLAVLVNLPAASFAHGIKAVRVDDDDTLRPVRNNAQIKVRLVGIETPEISKKECRPKALQPLYCLHAVYRLENEGREFDVFWVQIEPRRFLAVYDDPWKVRDPQDLTLDTHVSSTLDDHHWIGPRLHSLKYRIERWHRIKIDRAECWGESVLTFWIRMSNGRWILSRQCEGGQFHAEIVSAGPR
jgi:hypothetical protein